MIKDSELYLNGMKPIEIFRLYQTLIPNEMTYLKIIQKMSNGKLQKLIKIQKQKIKEKNKALMKYDNINVDIYCYCHKDSDLFMVGCEMKDKCIHNGWYHPKCVAELKNYPLLRNRIFQLNELCSNKKQLLDNINAYAQRITWHFTRLYRTRNAIIHLGSNPDYLRELVEHLHSYSDECLITLIFLLERKPQLETISNAVIHMQFRVEKIITRLKSKETEAVSKDDIDYFLDF